MPAARGARGWGPRRASDTDAEELLGDLCRKADDEGLVYVAEVEADERHAAAYPATGFGLAATAPVPWGPVRFCVRHPHRAPARRRRRR